MTAKERYELDRRQKSRDAIDHHFRECDRRKRLTDRRNKARVNSWMAKYHGAKA